MEYLEKWRTFPNSKHSVHDVYSGPQCTGITSTNPGQGLCGQVTHPPPTFTATWKLWGSFPLRLGLQAAAPQASEGRPLGNTHHTDPDRQVGRQLTASGRGTPWGASHSLPYKAPLPCRPRVPSPYPSKKARSYLCPLLPGCGTRSHVLHACTVEHVLGNESEAPGRSQSLRDGV